MPYLSASAVVIHYEEALYQVYAPLPLLIYSVTCYDFGTELGIVCGCVCAEVVVHQCRPSVFCV